jgi:hypothetical protein
MEREDVTFPYTQTMWSGKTPEGIHLFAWLTPAPGELATLCQDAKGPVLRIPYAAVKGAPVCESLAHHRGGTQVYFKNNEAKDLRVIVE